LNSKGSMSLRQKIAREAANLLYLGFEKEYKQAKLKAANTFGMHFLPTNLEVARELDRIAEENEGVIRRKRLVRMRKQALKLMNTLKMYNPVLIGSVWRGTINRKSDIDIVVYNDEPNDVLATLRQNKLKVLRTQRMTVTKQGQKKTSLHLHLDLPTREKAEVIVRSLEEINKKNECEIFGDTVKGLNIRELEKTLEKNPTKRYVPF
jgi:predicted nucleotidyltransferase